MVEPGRYKVVRSQLRAEVLIPSSGLGSDGTVIHATLFFPHFVQTSLFE